MFSKPPEPPAVDRQSSDLTALIEKLQGREAAVWIPLLQSLALAGVTALSVGLVMAAATALYHYRSWPLLIILAVVAVFCGVLSAFAWHLYGVARKDRERMIQLVEAIYNVDIDGDGKVAEAEPETTHIEVYYREYPGSPVKRKQFFDLPASLNDLKQMAIGILNGDGFADRVWGGPGKLFSQNKFIELRTDMESRGLIRRKGSGVTNGFEFTRAGHEALREWAGVNESPSPIAASED